MERNILLQQTIATNLVYYRKLMNLTQSQLAEKINYSDKAVSKWERAEGVPDIFVLKELADIYHVSVNDLISDKKKKTAPSYKRNKFIVTLLSCIIPWIVAIFTFIILNWTPAKDYFPSWMVFIYAIPTTCILLIVFTSLWGNKLMRFISISSLIWTICLSVFLTLILLNFLKGTAYLIFLLGIPLQFGAFLWLFLKKKKSIIYIDSEK